MKFRVSVREINFGSVVVDAKNKEEAITKAEEVYNEGNIHWIDSSLESAGVTKEQERDR